MKKVAKAYDKIGSQGFKDDIFMNLEELISGSLCIMAKNTIRLQYEQKMGNFLSKYWGAPL